LPEHSIPERGNPLPIKETRLHRKVGIKEPKTNFLDPLLQWEMLAQVRNRELSNPTAVLGFELYTPQAAIGRWPRLAVSNLSIKWGVAASGWEKSVS
jgi:hypothetical protein